MARAMARGSTSVTPLLGTNPLSMAAPGGFVLDMATSQVSYSKVLELLDAVGEPVGRARVVLREERTGGGEETVDSGVCRRRTIHR